MLQRSNLPLRDALIAVFLKLKELEIAWNIEKGRKHLNDPLRRGKDILRGLDETLIQLLLTLEEKDKEKEQKIKEILKDLRELEEHKLSLNGGRSFEEFWNKGSELFQRLHSIIEF